MAEAGIVAAVGALVAVFDLVPLGALPLGARLAWWIGGSLAAWLAFVLFARVGKAMARLLGLASYWGYLLAVPFTTLAVAFAVAGLTGGTAAMFGAGFAGLWLIALGIGAGFFLLFFAIYARAGEAAEPESPPAPAPEPAPLALRERGAPAQLGQDLGRRRLHHPARPEAGRLITRPHRPPCLDAHDPHTLRPRHAQLHGR